MLDTKAIAEATAAVVKAHVAALVEPLRLAVADLDKRVSALPAPRDGKDADEGAIVARVRDEVSTEIKELRAVVDAIQPAPELPDIAGMVKWAVSDAREQDAAQIQAWMDGVDEKFAALPAPRDGKDADPELIKQLVDDAVAALPPAPAGKDADPEVVRQMVAEAVAGLPQPKDGKDGRDGTDGAPGRDGADADPDIIRQMVAEAVAALPPARDGKDADPIDPDEIRSMVADIVQPAIAAIPLPQDGKSVTVDDVRPMIEDAVAKAVSALPKAKDGEAGKDGVGLAGAVIDRDGSLVVTLTNGDTKQLGRVVGKDGEQGQKGADGHDGVGFDDLDMVEDERGILLRFAKGDLVREFALPVVIDRGVYREGTEYRKGSGVTWAGSFWIAQRDNPGKPDTADSGWRLAVKKGQNGKDAK